MEHAKPKWDLSGGEITVDYEDLIHVAKIAVGLSHRELNRMLQRWQCLDPEEQPTKLDAEYMLTAAKYLADSSTVLYYLHEGRDRSIVKVENHDGRENCTPIEKERGG